MKREFHSSPGLTEYTANDVPHIETDSLGRPLHPWREKIPDLKEGKGVYWEWGPNYTVDSIIINQVSLLLVRRTDNNKWALPGGFIDEGESVLEASIRETYEESGVTLEGTNHQIVYSGPTKDERAHLNAWPETTALLWRVNARTEPKTSEETSDSRWMPLDMVRKIDLHGSHQWMIEKAIIEYGTPHEKIEYYGSESEVVKPNGGHMGYDRSIITLPSQERYFIKSHDENKFSDAVRAHHSKLYLVKEHDVYQNANHINDYLPSSVHLESDDRLIMEALDERDGWHWRILDGIKAIKYIEDVLAALSQMSQQPIIHDRLIDPTHQTLHREGWLNYHQNREAIRTRLLSSDIDEASVLSEDLDRLYQLYKSMPQSELTNFAHHDMRQSNIAWHPSKGVRLVDWSWAGPGTELADTTSFLIDLEKSGRSVNNYKQYFDVDHAIVLIGFWLEHSTWPAHNDNDSVRLQQILSAIAAHRLVNKLSSN
ncbi:hypothetical protein CR969_00390 [Candidatus Saccharibacteria bacterium]|nr:MAG: hypothetical protein CR969_00390 [Candidatus Saccharibacteria bacterium]